MISCSREKPIFLGLMSGTSLDGIDAVAVNFSSKFPQLLGHVFLPYSSELRKTLSDLCSPGNNEIERAQDVSVELGQLYAQAVLNLLDADNIPLNLVRAVGIHGQTVRHQPKKRWSLQLNAPALVAELTGLDVVADFRSRDIAANGEGAPLVPAFHAAVFASKTPRAVVNIGGIANVTLLPGSHRFVPITGFDCGPGNTLLDAWCEKKQGTPFDEAGNWAATGKVNDSLLAALLSHPYFAKPSPKSTGREEFNLSWLESLVTNEKDEDVERTLVALTARTIAKACRGAQEVYLCGGGTKNALLVSEIRKEFPSEIRVAFTSELGIDPMHVEAMAFAWLTWNFFQKKTGNLCEATHAAGRRILGALYPH